MVKANRSEQEVLTLFRMATRLAQTLRVCGRDDARGSIWGRLLLPWASRASQAHSLSFPRMPDFTLQPADLPFLLATLANLSPSCAAPLPQAQGAPSALLRDREQRRTVSEIEAWSGCFHAGRRTLVRV